MHNLGDILRLPAHGDRSAYIDLRNPQRVRRLTAAELDRLIGGVARGLLRRCIRRGQRVGILSANRLEFAASYFGIMRAGAVAVPINHRLPRSTLEHIFGDATIQIAFCDGERRPQVPEGATVINFDDDGPDGFEASVDIGPLESVVPDEQEIAEVLYTSGSTGVPKGVPLSHHGQLWAIRNSLLPLGASLAEETTLIVAPLYHMNGLYFMTEALANRVTVISQPRFEARAYLEAVARFRCTQLSGIPTMFAMMVREPIAYELDFTSVAHIRIGSAPLTEALLARVQRVFPHARVRNCFGTTEAGPSVFGEHPLGKATPALSIGHSRGDVEYRLEDGPSEDEGLLALRTPAMMRGYLNLPDVTAAKLREGWYLTGDRMRRDADGFYFFAGRSDDMIVCGGENIYPAEIETLLERHPGVSQAVVVPAPDDLKGQIPVAFVVPRDGVAPDVEDIKQFALANGPAYAHPRFVVLLDFVPVSGTHKIDRSALMHEAERLSLLAGRSS